MLFRSEMVAHFIADYTGSGQLPPKSGPYFAFASPYGIFDASDREFYLGASHQKSYEQFCHLIDREDLIADPRFTSNADRITNRAALHEELFPIFRTRTAQEWVTLLEDAGIPTSLVETLAEVTRQEQMAARELLLPTGVDDVAMIGIALKMGLTPGSVRRPPPELGADTEAVLAEQRQSRHTVAADAGALTPRPAQPGICTSDGGKEGP